eukprot:3467940-Amphidinium_carterae.1
MQRKFHDPHLICEALIHWVALATLESKSCSWTKMAVLGSSSKTSANVCAPSVQTQPRPSHERPCKLCLNHGLDCSDGSSCSLGSLR